MQKTIIQISIRIIISLILSAVLLEAGAQPETVLAAANLYVATSGTDSGACTASNKPCKTIQYAVNQASSGDTIRVAGGIFTYVAQVDTCSFLATRAVVCLLDKNISILGSFDTQNWVTPDNINHPSIIDGGNTYRGVAIIAYNSTANLHLEGFTIQNGLAQGIQSANSFFWGGFGGGMWAQNSTVVLDGVIFKNNRAVGADLNNGAGGDGAGGGLAIQSSKNRATSTLNNVTFEGNEAVGGTGVNRGGIAVGGALFTYDLVLVGTNLNFSNNKARAGSSSGSGSDGGLNADALGGAAGFQINSDITLTSLTATGNQAIGGNAGSTGTGGGGFGGAISAEQSTFRMSDVKIERNQALAGTGNIGGHAMGGGMMTDMTNTTIDRAQVIANYAKSGGSLTSYLVGSVGGGGGNFVYWGSVGTRSTTITNSIFADNKVETGSPGRIVGGGGAGAAFQGVQATVTHCTFAHNTFAGGLKVGQAITVLGNGDGTAAVLGNLNMKYSIISDHIEPADVKWSSALTVLANNTATLSYVLFANNTRNTNQDGLPMAPGIFNITNPLSASSVGYVSLGSPNYDYHLTGTSSAIDKAVGSTTLVDIDGNARPVGRVSDVGAVEYLAPTLMVVPTSLTVLAAPYTNPQSIVNVEINFGAAVSWTATSNASWLLPGVSGSSQSAQGTTGDTLILRFQTSGLQVGTYDTSVDFTSPSASSTSLPVHLIVVANVYSSFIPSMVR